MASLGGRDPLIYGGSLGRFPRRTTRIGAVNKAFFISIVGDYEPLTFPTWFFNGSVSLEHLAWLELAAVVSLQTRILCGLLLPTFYHCNK